MKKLFFVSGCLLFVLAVSWMWRTEAIAPQIAEQAEESREDVTLRTLTRQSDLIVSGRSVSAETRWIEDGRVLVTLATVAVDEVVKGDAGAAVTVVLPGGIDANRPIPVAMTYAGAPNISAGEEVFLFLTSDDSVAGGYAVTNFSEGKFSIVEDESGNKLISNAYLKDRVKTAPGVVRGNRQFTPAAAFKNKVRNYLGQE